MTAAFLTGLIAGALLGALIVAVVMMDRRPKA